MVAEIGSREWQGTGVMGQDEPAQVPVAGALRGVPDLRSAEGFNRWSVTEGQALRLVLLPDAAGALRWVLTEAPKDNALVGNVLLDTGTGEEALATALAVGFGLGYGLGYGTGLDKGRTEAPSAAAAGSAAGSAAPSLPVPVALPAVPSINPAEPIVEELLEKLSLLEAIIDESARVRVAQLPAPSPVTIAAPISEPDPDPAVDEDTPDLRADTIGEHFIPPAPIRVAWTPTPVSGDDVDEVLGDGGDYRADDDDAAPISSPAPMPQPAWAAESVTVEALAAPPPTPSAPASSATAPSTPGSDRIIKLPAIAPDQPFTLPGVALLADPAPRAEAAIEDEALDTNARLLESVLQDFNVKGEIVDVRPGPVVTLYEFEPAPGTKSSRIIGLADDIARSMSAIAVRIAVVPGRSVIGIELPNPQREMVYLSEMLRSDDYSGAEARLPLILGKDIGGVPVVADLARMPHLLIAGTTGSGKSVGINTFILSLLFRHGPRDCRLIMIDPKMLELSVYDGIPHLLTPVVTDPKKAVVALKWAVREMEDRYRAMAQLGVRNIEGYNAKVAEVERSGQKPVRRVPIGFDKEAGQTLFEEQEIDLTHLPYIVIVVDEMADLMLVAGKEIEATIQRLAQMARAAGIHLIMATQRPSVDVITGTIKANFPTRISFQVTSKIDSRTILGDGGAEQLLGQGDMLYMAAGGRLTRVHGPFVSDGEVEHVVTFLKSQGAPAYVEGVTLDEEEDGEERGPGSGPGGAGFSGDDAGGDELYDEAVAVVLRERKASTSFIQRHLQIGYNRAARLVEKMEADGVVGPPNHVGKREILVRGRMS